MIKVNYRNKTLCDVRYNTTEYLTSRGTQSSDDVTVTSGEKRTEIRSHIGISLRDLQLRESFNPDTQVKEYHMLLPPLKSAKPPLSENVSCTATRNYSTSSTGPLCECCIRLHTVDCFRITQNGCDCCYCCSASGPPL